MRETYPDSKCNITVANALAVASKSSWKGRPSVAAQRHDKQERHITCNGTDVLFLGSPWIIP